MRKLLPFLLLLAISPVYAQFLLAPDRVFDGNDVHENWVVQVENNFIVYAGPESGKRKLKGEQRINLPGQTLIPGMIEGHGHLFLYPYNETPWNDQVLKESESFRTAKATVHAKDNLMAGFTTFRDLGTEGAGYADYGLKQAIEKGVIPGPRLLISSRAIVATGSYGPKGFSTEFEVPLGAQPADASNLVQVVREQIGKGADFIKVYADYRWGPKGEAMPTFSESELRLIVETAASSGRVTVAHAATAEGMRRAIRSGVKTIEHGDGGTPEIFKMMKDMNVGFCPTIAAGHAITMYSGWDPDKDPDPARIINKKKSFAAALESGVDIVAGGDVGVFSHGHNVLELELMVEYGMEPIDVLRSVTKVNARYFGLNELGQVKEGYLADLVAVEGDPSKNIEALREIRMVMLDGKIIKE